MNSKPSFKVIYQLAWPTIISYATVILIGVINLAFIARLGNATLAIAAVAIANNIYGAIFTFLEGIRSGTTILVARFSGAQQPENISKTLNLALFYAFILGIILLILTPIITPLTYKFFEPSIGQIGKPFLIIRLLGFPFFLLTLAIIGFFRGLKNTAIPLALTVIACTINTGLNYLLMYSSYGFTSNGVAIASTISDIIGFLISVAFLLFLPLTKKYIHPKTSFKSIHKSFVTIGTEIGLNAGVIVLALLFFVFMFTSLGTEALATHQIVFQSFMILYVPILMGFSIASSIIIGSLLGEKKTNAVIPTTLKIWIASLPIIGIISIATFIFAPNIAAFFSPTNTNVAHLATQSIYLVAISQILNSAFTVLKGSLAAAKDTRFLFISGTISSYLFFLPLSYILGIKLEYGVWGGYLAFLLWNMLDSIILTYRFFIRKPWLG